nr:immunoglobulin light chain junction region [Macaca mulatta]
NYYCAIWYNDAWVF